MFNPFQVILDAVNKKPGNWNGKWGEEKGNTGYVRVWEDWNKNGNSSLFGHGDYTAEKGEIENDKISSLYIYPYTSVTLYNGWRQNDESVSWTAQKDPIFIPYLSEYDFNDKTTSISVRALDPRCLDDSYDSYVVTPHVTRPSSTQRALYTTLEASDNHWYHGWKRCPISHTDWRLKDRQNYYDKTKYTGGDYFVAYNADGSKKYCREQLLDYGWEQKSWSPENWQVYKNECVMYQRTYPPAIRQDAGDPVLPKLTRGGTAMELTKAAYGESDLGAMAGQSVTVAPAPYFYVRTYSGTNYTGVAKDFGTSSASFTTGGVRSARVNPLRPVIFSRSDNYLKKRFMAVLKKQNGVYSQVDLDDGVFSTSETGVRAGISGVWVPPGFMLKIYVASGPPKVYFGHNTNGYQAVDLVPKGIESRLVMPVTYSLQNYQGYINVLKPGDNSQSPGNRVESLGIPFGTKVTGRKSGNRDTIFRNYVPQLGMQYSTLVVDVDYTEKVGANMIDNVNVRTKVYRSKKNFEKECKQECSANYDCKAYYALKMMRECPNPDAVDGQDPAVNGCKEVCGFYEAADMNLATVNYRAIEPQLYSGKLWIKQDYTTQQ